LWSMPLPAAYTFVEWRRPDGTVWNFATDTVTENITLTAHWAALTPALPFTTMAAAMSHANNNTASGPFTLAIAQDVTATGTLTLSANADLTVVGIGEEREINRTGLGRLFDVPASGARLTLGENITLRGHRTAADLVRVQNGGRFYLKDGSQISGHANTSWAASGGAGAAVNIQANGTFTMSGGTITGNTASNVDTDNSGGVFMLNETSHFIMTGGRIYGNHRGDGVTPADVFINAVVDHFTLSGDASIGRLTLGSSADINSFITVGSEWSGGVAYLDLRASSASVNTVINSWTGNTVLQAAEGRTLTAADVGRFNWNTARFIGNAEGITQPASQTRSIVLEDGAMRGVLRANP